VDFDYFKKHLDEIISEETTRKSNLSEKYGVEYLTDGTFYNEAKEIADFLLSYDSNKQITDSVTKVTLLHKIEDIVDVDGPYDMITFQDVTNWLSELNIIIYKHNKPIEPVFATLTDSFTYSLNDDGTYAIKKIDTMFFKSDNHDVLYAPYVRTSDHVSVATVFMSFSKAHEVREYSKDNFLTYVLAHEIGHIFDMFKNKRDGKWINIDSNEMQKFPDMPSGKFKIQLRALYDVDKTYVERSKIISSLSADAIADLFYNAIYSLSRSEMRQRLKNFLWELSMNKLSDYTGLRCLNAKRNDKDSQYSNDKMCRLSFTFNYYFRLKQAFDMLVGSCLKPVKIEFAKNIISKVSQKNDALEQKFPYGKTFAVNGEYDDKSFDMFFSHFSDLIYDVFLRNAASIIYELISEPVFNCNVGNMLFQNRHSVDEKLYVHEKEKPWDNM
jgi:hypothetical protein